MSKAIVGGVLGLGAIAAVVHWWPTGPRKPARRSAASGAAAPPGEPSPPPTDTDASVPSSEVRAVSPSTADFAPGALRLQPLVRVSRWHTFAPGVEIVTQVQGGHYVQAWSVAPDGVTLTAIAEPLVATPELLGRATADLARARAVRRAPGHHDRRMGGGMATGYGVPQTAPAAGDADALAGVLSAVLRGDR